MSNDTEQKLPHQWLELPPGKAGDDVVESSPSGRCWREQVFVNRSAKRLPGGERDQHGYPHCQGRDF